ncbi:MAG: cysteine desulfurase [Nitrospirae bacterium]|nr:cysteine desulfurase [Nitrospirota bacterium]
MIYLDHNASTPVDPEVTGAMHSALSLIFANPSSTHAAGLKAREAVEDARSHVAALIGVSPDEIYFTSGGTESNNLAILGAARAEGKGHIITSAIEHPSVLKPCEDLERNGFGVTYVRPGSDGRVAPEEIRRQIRKETFLITVMHANNETGVLQPIEEISRIAKESAVLFHTDAAQTVGKIPLSAKELGTDMLTVVSHKFYGPKGVGALFMRKGVDVKPVLFGAGHEKGLRPGTENVPGIVGLGTACALAKTCVRERAVRTRKLTDMLYRGLRAGIGDLRLNGSETLRLPNTLNVCLPGIDSLDLLEALKDKVAAGAGSACHAGKRSPSPVLLAMGISEADALSSLRLTTGKDNTPDEIKTAVEIIAKAVRDRRR